ncbi:sensor histidine kinase [Actinophytocola xanthii]|uniref:sensor histidine kinase n=1 Tax=Actinophytocola xanthii TaxID=1912961 RepID=UPI0009F94394|nr:ATP-binding protein [Actinophytocola xanthii]
MLSDPRRTAAVERGLQRLPSQPMSLHAVARLAAQLLGASMGMVTLVGAEREHVAGVYNLPPELVRGRGAPLSLSVCKYVVSANYPVSSEDMALDPALRGHRLALEHGVRAFLGVPLRGTDQPLGSVTVLDVRPRRWTDDDVSVLLAVGQVIGPIPVGEDACPMGLGGCDPHHPAAFLTALLDTLDPAVLACVGDGNVVLVNQALRRVLGLPPGAPPARLEDLVAGRLFRTDRTLLPIEENPMRRALAGEPVHDESVLVRVPSRPERVFVVKGRPATGSAGERVGAVVAMHDVTAVRRAERFYTCSSQVLEALTADIDLDDRYHRVLEAVCTALGWAHAELWLVDPVRDRLRLRAGWTAPGRPPVSVRETTAPGVGISGAVWAAGRPLWVPDLTATRDERDTRPDGGGYAAAGLRTALAVPVQAERTVGVLACFSDVPESDEVLLTTLLGGVAAQIGQFLAYSQRDQLLRELTRARQDFSRLAGHEIRTPLTAIISCSEMLLEDPVAAAGPGRQVIEVISRNATSLHAVITQLLDFAAIQTGAVPMDRGPVELADVLEEAVRNLDYPPGIDLRVEFRARPTVRGDRMRLRQVMDALLTNAVKYSPEGGPVHVALTAERGTVSLTVADEGIGVPAEERDKVFEYFFRSSAARQRQIPGAGLGLAAARAIVEQHGGRIVVDGQYALGTRVAVLLPDNRP